MFKKLLESLYHRIFVNIVVNKSTTTVYIETCNSSGMLDSQEEIFKTTTMDEKMYEFISSYTKESPYYYISLLDTSSSQGALTSCSMDKTSMFLDKNSSTSKCFKDKWTYYSSKQDIKEMQHQYEKIGIDFLFSPFIILVHFFEDKIDTHMAMFILIEDNYITLSVFNNSQLLFATHLDMEYDTESDELMIEEEEESTLDLDDDGIDLDDIDALDGMDGLDDFGDIEDLDSIDEIDEFADTRDIEEELTEEAQEDNMPISDSDGFTEDYHRYSMIQSAVNNFYKDKNYDSQFIETVYIADGVGISGDLKTYLEEEMFLSVYIRRVELATEVCELAKMELK